MPGVLVGAYLVPLYQQYNLARLLAPCIYYCLDSGYVPLSHVAQALPLLPCLRTLQVLPPTCHHLGTQVGPVPAARHRP